MLILEDSVLWPEARVTATLFSCGFILRFHLWSKKRRWEETVRDAYHSIIMPTVLQLLSQRISVETDSMGSKFLMGKILSQKKASFKQGTKWRRGKVIQRDVKRDSVRLVSPVFSPDTLILNVDEEERKCCLISRRQISHPQESCVWTSSRHDVTHV